MMVYVIENQNNGRKYVGITTKPLRERWAYHIHTSKKGTAVLSRAIRKHGPHSFSIESIETCHDETELRLRETHWIKSLGTFVKDGGYNMTWGGDGIFGYKHTDKAKAAMSLARKGDKNHNYGKSWGKTEWSDAEKKMMSEKHGGKNNPMFGKNHSEEARTKISAALRKRVRKVTAVDQLDLDGNFVATFKSAQLAAKSLGTSGHNHILCICRSQKGTYKGFTWQYAKSVPGER